MTNQPNDPTVENINELKTDDEEQIPPARDDHPDNDESDESPIEADLDGDEEDQTDVDIPEELYQEADPTSPDEDK